MGPTRQPLAVLIITAWSTPCSPDRSEGFQLAEARSTNPIHLSRLRRSLVNSTVPVRPGDGERSTSEGVSRVAEILEQVISNGQPVL
jgi:hypothetical protein